MATPKIIGALRDWSMGEVDVSTKRADESQVMRIGARQMTNFRILSSGIVKNRPGRSPLFLETGRVEPVLMAPSQKFYLAFGNGYLRVYNAAGTRVFNSTVKGDGTTPISWNTSGLASIVYAIPSVAGQFLVYITYVDGTASNVPQILTWDGVSQTSTWTLSTFAETVSVSGQKRTIFYRISPQSITLAPSGLSGNINIVFSAPVLTAGMIGTRLRWCYGQMTITGVTDSEHGTATVNDGLPVAQNIVFNSNPIGTLFIGDLVTGSATGAQGIVTNLNSSTATVQLLGLKFGGFLTTDTVVGPRGAMGGIASTSTVTSANQAVSLWDNEVMNNFRGWPSSVFFDQNRLGFSSFPSVQSGIAWSALGLTGDFYPEGIATADDAIFELAPGKSIPYYVVPGMESSEFVLCDNAIYYIPINVNNPLQPGSVTFNELSGFGCAPNVQPRRAEQTIIFLKAGGIEVGAIQAPGAYYRPYIVDHISEMHAHLFTASAVTALAVPAATSQFEEHYIYASLANGTLVVGKYQMRNGLIEPGQDGKPKVGWAPWNGAGAVSWVAALTDEVDFTANYAPNGVPAVSIVEKLDNTKWLDGALFVNNLPAPFVTGGKGPCFAFPGPNSTVFLIDLGTRFMGVYQVDANGWIVPQNQGGENLNSAQLVAGQPWTATLEPFTPIAAPGQDMGQRIKKRRASRIVTYTSQSTGFLIARLFSGPIRPSTTQPLGAIMNSHRVPAYEKGDDATKAAPLREGSDYWRPIGRSYDPRYAVVKDTPGPLMIHELTFEAGV